MTKDNLVTAPVGTISSSQEILRKHKIEKLPLVDENGFLKGLITIKDIEKSVQYPNTARDAGADSSAALRSELLPTCSTEPALC